LIPDEPDIIEDVNNHSFDHQFALWRPVSVTDLPNIFKRGKLKIFNKILIGLIVY